MGWSILGRWSISLECQYHTLLITLGLKQGVKPGSGSSPTVVFFLDFSHIHMKLRIRVPVPTENHWYFDWHCTEATGEFAENGQIHNSGFSDKWTWQGCLFTWVLLNFSKIGLSHCWTHPHLADLWLTAQSALVNVPGALEKECVFCRC